MKNRLMKRLRRIGAARRARAPAPEPEKTPCRISLTIPEGRRARRVAIPLFWLELSAFILLALTG